MSEENRNGRWTKKESKFVMDNYQVMTPEDIATQLKRNPTTIRRFLRERVYKHAGPVKEIQEKHHEFDIQKSPMWRDIKNQFTADEQKMFLYHWSNIVTQFKYDVLPTERMQIVDVARIEILLGRALSKTKEIQDVIEGLKKQITEEKAKPIMAEDPDDRRDMLKIEQLTRTMADFYVSNTNFQKDYKDLLDKKTALLKEIKGTREQRIKRIEDSKENLTTWLAAIVADSELRGKLGRDMEIMRLAATAEYDRLSEYHTYVNGEVEQPILNHETIKEDNN